MDAPNSSATELTRAEIERRLSASGSQIDLSNRDLTGADLRGVIFYAGQLEKADLSDADLSRARIIGGGRGVSLRNAKLVDADLGADPANQGMAPVRAESPDANFEGVDATRANFTHAVLTGANFTGAVITGVRFDHAVMDGANITLAR